MKHIAAFFIVFYRKVISPLKRNASCCYVPTCSQYALDAVELHGAVRGGVLAVFRILRCNPFSKGGYDPVPRDNASLHRLLKAAVAQRRRILDERRLAQTQVQKERVNEHC